MVTSRRLEKYLMAFSNIETTSRRLAGVGGSNSAVLDKDLLKRLEDIESLSLEDRDKIYYFIDMAVRDAKARQAYK